MLDPEDRWIWDFWHVQDQGLHHLYYLHAPKSLGDPELRHRNATIGHATSPDLSTWTEHGTVLRPGGAGAIDATATWTGSVVRDDHGLWRMFYTGSTFLTPGTTRNIEVVGLATSPDLYTWTKDETFELSASRRHYETFGDSDWPEEAWRDPWVYREDDGEWHMLITARANRGDLDDRGVVGHATSKDLQRWEVRPPLTAPGAGFGHLEVIQKVSVDGEQFALFSSHVGAVPARRHGEENVTGTWIAPWTDKIHLESARNLTGPNLYSGRLIDLDGVPVLLAFHLDDDGAVFVGGITDPIPVRRIDGTLRLDDRVGAR